MAEYGLQRAETLSIRSLGMVCLVSVSCEVVPLRRRHSQAVVCVLRCVLEPGSVHIPANTSLHTADNGLVLVRPSALGSLHKFASFQPSNYLKMKVCKRDWLNVSL
jgi:hypothetical protein